MKTYVVVPDIHVPFHDPKYIKLISRAIEMLSPTGVIHLGDALDFFQLSRFDKDPARKNTARDDLEIYREIMIKWAALLPPGGVYHALEGNHENRLTRYIWGRAGEIAQMVNAVPDMLGFRELNKTCKTKFIWHPIGNYRSCQIGDTILHHGVFYNKHTAVTNLERYRLKFITGHTHRVQLAYNESFFSCTLGHGSLEKETSHVPAPTGWQQAFGVLTEINGECHLEVVPVFEGRCLFRGEKL